MKQNTLLVLACLAAAPFASAATLVDTHYTSTQTISSATDYFLEGGATATWTIDSGFTLTSVDRFFIATTGGSNTGTATFILTGGGTFIDNSVSTYGFRLGQDSTSEIGAFIIQGGTTFQMTNVGGPFSQKVGSTITLSGLGSTFIGLGTYNAGTGVYSSGNVNSTQPLVISATGGTLQTSYNSGTNTTTFTVVPEPSTYGLMGAGALAAAALVRRRRVR